MVKQRGETLTYNKWIQKTIGTITNRPIRNAGRSYNIKHTELLTQSKKKFYLRCRGVARTSENN